MISFFRHVHKSLQSEVVFCQPAHRHNKHLDQLGTLIDSFIVSVLKNGDGLKMQMCRLFIVQPRPQFQLVKLLCDGPKLIRLFDDLEYEPQFEFGSCNLRQFYEIAPNFCRVLCT